MNRNCQITFDPIPVRESVRTEIELWETLPVSLLDAISVCQSLQAAATVTCDDGRVYSIDFDGATTRVRGIR